MKKALITLPEGYKADNVKICKNLLFYDVIEETKDMAEIDIPAFVARDRNGKLFMYLKTAPRKEDIAWITSNEYISVNSALFPSVKWENDEPTKVRIKIETI